MPVMGVDTVYSLSALERDELRDVYRNWNTGAAASKDLQFVLGQTHLPGFDWTQLNLGGVLPVGPLDGFDWVVTPPATPPRNVTAPTLTGLAQPGQTLTLNPGVWSADGATLYTYQWLDNGSEIVGEISATYVVPDDGSTVGHAVTAVVTAQAAGLTTQVSTQAVTIALPVVPPHNSVLPSIQGIAAPGNTLTASLGSWSASSTMIFTLQWLANGVAVPGATNVSYVIPNSAAQVGVALSVTVTALASGVATPATSAVVVVVAN